MTDPHLNCSRCPQCGGALRVADTRAHTDFGFATTRRRKACNACGVKFNTIEVLSAVAEDVFAEDADASGAAGEARA